MITTPTGDPSGSSSAFRYPANLDQKRPTNEHFTALKVNAKSPCNIAINDGQKRTPKAEQALVFEIHEIDLEQDTFFDQYSSHYRLKNGSND